MCVLIADDEAMVRELVAESFRDAGREVMTADTAAAAVDLLQQWPNHFTALVTDHYMPGLLKGADLAVHTRQLYPQLPIVVITGLPDDVPPGMLVEHRIRLIPKPFAFQDLVRAVQG